MKKALIVDDSGLARMMIIKCLQMADRKNEFSVVEAGDGETALKVLTEESVDLIISDLNMPNLSGEDLLRRIKNWEERKTLPIFLISSKINDAKMQELLSLGASAVMKKPITPTHLIQAFANLDI